MAAKGRLTIAIDDTVRKNFKLWCLSKGVTMSDVLERIASDLAQEEATDALNWFERQTWQYR